MECAKEREQCDGRDASVGAQLIHILDQVRRRIGAQGRTCIIVRGRRSTFSAATLVKYQDTVALWGKKARHKCIAASARSSVHAHHRLAIGIAILSPVDLMALRLYIEVARRQRLGLFVFPVGGCYFAQVHDGGEFARSVPRF